MPRPRTRRRALQALGSAAVAAFAGCTAENDGTRETTTTTTTTSTETTTAVPDTDERVSARPPGDPALSPSGAWPAPGFDAANTSANPDGSGLRDGEAYWRLDAGGRASVADGTLYNCYDRDQDYADLTRRDPATMEMTSRTRLVRYGVSAPPVVADGRVYVTTFVEAFCVAADRDAVLWRGPEMNGIQAPPAVADGVAYVNSGGFEDAPAQLRAFDAASGEERWRYDAVAETKSTPTVADGTVYVPSADGLHAVDAASGERVFHQPAVADRWADAAVADGTVYAVGASDDATLYALDAASGDVRWRAPVGSRSAPVVTGERVYAETPDGPTALDAADGKPATGLGGAGTPEALVGDVVYATERGTLYALDADGGGVLWSHETSEVQISDTVGRRIYGVTPVEGAVYVAARDAFHGLGPAR